MNKPSAIGALLVREGLVDEFGLGRALTLQSKEGLSLGRALADLGLADENAVCAAIAKGFRLELLAAEPPAIEPELQTLLPVKFCQRKLVVPLSVKGKSLRLGMADPLDYSTIQDVKFQTSKEVAPVAATQTAILTLLSKFRSEAVEAEETYESLIRSVPEGEIVHVGAADDEDVDAVRLANETKLAPIIRLVNLMLSGAAKGGASDIHVEPKETTLLVRQRVDGLLHDVFKIPKHLQDATVSRLKIMSGMDISEHRRPQDGRSQFRYEGKRIDLRLSSLPTQYGEKLVVRLLDQRRAQMTIEQMDLTAENLKALKSMLARPQGMILVTGPTGSGKSSTVYTSLNWVKSGTNNIITIEDPIEYQLDGVNQVQINSKAGVTFASGLRSILRQDPNIIFVGEIRDQETADIALQAAQTGHLLLSTLHTNDAPATISRLLDLGIEPFLIASALIGILAQRLVRRTCLFCAVPEEPSAEIVEKLGGRERLPASGKWLIGRGCEKCGQSGYKGRLAIHEMLVVNDEMRDLMSRRAPEHEFRRAARVAGMRTMLEDGIMKAAQGLTTLEAVLKVIKMDEENAEETEGAAVQDHAAMPRVEATVTASKATPSATEIQGENGSKKKDRVLIVEDDRTITSVVKYFLELEGFEVVVAENGLTGLKAAKKETPQIIVTDCHMPVMDGVAMVEALRADAQTQVIYILMLTSGNTIEDETRALAAGADDYILKPVEPRRLVARIKTLLTRSKRKQLSDAK
ncbi:MAG TPA: ATPase, T2SS/T4P/T4SS family [Candidatus Acidoferrales bacterium]|nr:ATPase, T2SS/T4P/T4SS family [Candidatus Acidoferrales bacterium]